MGASGSGRPGVFVYRPVDDSGESHRRLSEAGCDVTIGDGRAIPEQDLPLHPVHALLGATHAGGRIGTAEFERWPALRLVAKYTIGTDDVDVDAATRLGILVTHCPTEANWGGVAEGTMAMMLTVLKKVIQRDRSVRSGAWRDAALEGIYLGARQDGYPGITIGIVGLGRIGRRLAELLRPWGVRVVAADPYVDQSEFERRGVTRVSLDELLAAADVVTLHCNLSAETTGLIDQARIARMRPGAMLINTARGAIVDVDALCAGLESGQVSAAALDVFPDEPLPDRSPLRHFGDRVLLSPHMVAANRGGTLKAAIPWATDAVLAALSGEVPEHVYNEGAIERWRSRFGGRPLISRCSERGNA